MTSINHKIKPRPLSDDELIDLFEFKRNPIIQFYEYIGITGAEWNYAVGVPLNYASLYSNAIPYNAGLGITLGWNYLDGVYSIGLGIFQLLDEEDYRQTQNKAKGLLNILSGVQLFLLSYNPALTAALGLTGGTALAAPAFALSMAFDLLTAAIDFYSIHQEMEFEGWLEERAKEISYHQTRIEKLNAKIETLDITQDKLEIDYLQAKKRKIEINNQHIKEAIYARSRVNQGSYDPVKKILRKYGLGLNKDELKKEATTNDHAMNLKIQKQLNENYKQSRLNLMMKTASFIGMTLLAVSGFVSCPPLLITGLAITTLVAAYFIYKHRKTIINSIDAITNKLGFFNNTDVIAVDNSSQKNLPVIANSSR
jgi:hypothetical protein